MDVGRFQLRGKLEKKVDIRCTNCERVNLLWLPVAAALLQNVLRSEESPHVNNPEASF